jgi:peptidyl-prolyl cis-trans isomerase B (cyclophilin B)
MIQGGGFDADLHQKDTNAPIKNEADNGLTNDKYTIAMARTGEIDSATAQFFINNKTNDFLNHSGPGPRFGYAVFGKVVSGQDVVDKISAVETTTRDGYENVPVTTVKINSIKRK